MKLHVVYRISASENHKARPAFYSKRVALASFLESLARVEVVGDVHFLCDGPVSEDLVATMRARGAIVELPGLGNSGSYRRALAMLHEPPRWSDDDLVYFAEDDYLYRPEALAEMVTAAHEIVAASFFTPYDHPDYQSTPVHQRFRRLHRKELWNVGSTRWRSVRSTTMTFGARVGPMRAAAGIHELGTRGPGPRDFETWSALQSTSPRFLVARTVGHSDALDTVSLLRALPRCFERRDLLVAPEPSLATHLEDPWLAVGGDWEALAARLAARP